jgi:UDP-N-acetylglucosamine--N-acetylmuramyl-(pentapeptide) pyrophosphoryl-undecaprenol N-acetylglucosamine transferase
MVKILFTGGATGGHIYPIVAVARELQNTAQKRSLPLELMFAGSADFNLEVLRQESIKTYRVPTGKIRRYASWKAPWDYAKAFLGFIYSLFLVWFLMPDVIFAKGGYGSFGVAVAGRLYAIPLLVHDSDAVPGLVSRILGKIASRVAVSFPPAISFFNARKTAFVGNPVRPSLLKGDKVKAKTLFNLKGDRPIIFVMGGSQGAKQVNELVARTLHELLQMYEVVHQCGTVHVEELTKELNTIYGINIKDNPYYHLKGYIGEEEQTHLFAVSDLIISRAGASSIYEIALVGKPAILIPLKESAANHQHKNAFFYARVGAAVIIEGRNLSPNILLNEIKGILGNKNKQAEMIKAAQDFAMPQAGRKIAEGLIELALM